MQCNTKKCRMFRSFLPSTFHYSNPFQVRDLKAMGFGEGDRVFSPDKLPIADALLPSIQVCVRTC